MAEETCTAINPSLHMGLMPSREKQRVATIDSANSNSLSKILTTDVNQDGRNPNRGSLRRTVYDSKEKWNHNGRLIERKCSSVTAYLKEKKVREENGKVHVERKDNMAIFKYPRPNF